MKSLFKFITESKFVFGGLLIITVHAHGQNIFQSNGNVGIGITTPVAKLHVFNATQANIWTVGGSQDSSIANRQSHKFTFKVSFQN